MNGTTPKFLTATYTKEELSCDIPVYREWAAVAVGVMVGFAWWILHRAYFAPLYWFLVPPFKNLAAPPSFDALYLWLNANMALAQAFTVGLAVGLISRRHPYWLSLLAMLLAFVPKPLHDALDLWHNPRPPYEVAWAAWLFIAIYVGGPLLGVRAGRIFWRDPHGVVQDP